MTSDENVELTVGDHRQGAL